MVTSVYVAFALLWVFSSFLFYTCYVFPGIALLIWGGIQFSEFGWGSDSLKFETWAARQHLDVGVSATFCRLGWGKNLSALISFGCRGTRTFLNVFNQNCFLSQLWKQPQLCPCKVSHFKNLVAFAVTMSKLKRKSLGFLPFITWTAFRNRPGTANSRPQSIRCQKKRNT